MLNNTSPDRAIKVMCVRNEHLFDRYVVSNGHNKVKQYLDVIDGIHYDVFEYKPTNFLKNKLKLYYDIEAFFGKNVIISPNLDMPDHRKIINVSDFTQHDDKTCDALLKIFDVDIRKIKIEFKQYSSYMVGQHIADITPDRDKILVAAVREYHKETSIPIFHGYFVVRMMLDHKVQHLLDNHNFLDTENEFHGDYFCPQIGRDCMQFKPLPPYNYANDLLNYTFFSHNQNAFNEEKEIFGFVSSLHVAFKYNLFGHEEIIEKIKLAEVGVDTTENLLKAVELALPNESYIAV